ncbi:hypothetical protein HDV00_003017 [Rhizophlyctis rosea]|nr:hypothetical protein HDV00_003017 [Rhizophlyctis rosea]
MIIPTKAISGIATDPFHPYRFASFADDSIIRIWDARNASEPALTLNSEYRNGISQLEWSPLRSGLLASVGRESSVLKIWDIQEGTTKEFFTSTVYRSSPSQTAHSNLPGTSPGAAALGTSPGQAFAGGDGGHDGVPGASTLVAPSGALLPTGGGTGSPGIVEGPRGDSAAEEWGTVPVLWKTRQVKRTSPISGFAWMPIARPGDFSHNIITAHHRDPEYVITNLPVTYKMEFSPDGGLAVTGGKAVMMVPPHVTATPTDRLSVSGGDDMFTPLRGGEKLFGTPGRPSLVSVTGVASVKRDSLVELGGEITSSFRPINTLIMTHSSELATDMSVVMEERVLRGYSMDPDKNQEILTQVDGGLRELWRWIEQVKSLSSKGRMRVHNKDYSAQGIHAVIQEMTTSPALAKTPYTIPGTPRDGSSSPAAGSSAASSPQRKQEASLPFVTYTNYYRQLALLICGWDFHGGDKNSERNLEQVLSSMEASGEFEKAAGWALFHSSSLSRAIQALNKSNNERLKLVATTLAGYASISTGSSASTLWQDMCRSLSTELQDPYLRSMFALIASNGDWSVVLKEEGLSIRDRIGIALRFLDDEALLTYINQLTSSMVSEGNVAGLPLTGLTPMGVELFDRYVDRTGDVQTASLILSMVSPRRFTDSRVEDWVENYRFLLDRWQLYHARAQFDIARRKFVAGDPFLNQPPPANAAYNANVPPQVYVRCNFCNQPVVNGLFQAAVKKGGAGGGVVVPGTGPGQGPGPNTAALVLGHGKHKVGGLGCDGWVWVKSTH